MTTYNGSHYFMTVICPQHGPFEQMAKEHLRYGCRKCADAVRPILQKFTTKKFIKQAQSKHGNLYDYSKVQYAGTEIPVEIVCHKHGSFFQTPHDHYSGEAGCTKCTKIDNNPGGYNPKRFQNNPTLATTPGILYLVSLEMPDDSALKIGITKMTVSQRFSVRCYPYNIQPILEVKTTLQQAFTHEQQTLDQFSHYAYCPSWVLDGRTECFRSEALLDLCEWLDE